MKNKKLFAILTLVCFMFTLMPVAAFAATAPAVTAVSDVSKVNAEGIAVEGFSVKLTNVPAGTVQASIVDANGTVIATNTINVATATATLWSPFYAMGYGDSWTITDAWDSFTETPAKFVANVNGTTVEKTFDAAQVATITAVIDRMDAGKAAAAVLDAGIAALDTTADAADIKSAYETATANRIVANYVSADTVNAYNEALATIAYGAASSADVYGAKSTFATVEKGLELDMVGASKSEIGAAVITLKNVNGAAATDTIYVWAEAVANEVSPAFVASGSGVSAVGGTAGLYQITLTGAAEINVGFTTAGTYTLKAATDAAYIAAGDDLAKIKNKLTVPAAYGTVVVNNMTVDSKLYTMTVKAPFAEALSNEDVSVHTIGVDANGVEETNVVVAFTMGTNVLPGLPVTISTSSSSIEVTEETLYTDYKGEVEFAVSGTVEGNYTIDIECLDFEAAIKVAVGSVAASDIELVKEPAAPIALNTSAAIFNAGERVQVAITDVNGNGVTSGAANMGVANAADADSKYVSFVEKPAKSKLTNKDIFIAHDENGVWTLCLAAGEKLDAEGTYTVKIILDNGRAVTASFEVKKFQEPVRIIFDSTPATVELGTTVAPRLLFVDANGVTDAVGNKAELTATGYAIDSFNGATLVVKSDEKYAGSVIKLTAVSEKYDLVATKEIKVATEAVAIEFEATELEVGVNNKVEWNVVDENGNVVELDDQYVKGYTVKYVVLDKPENAKVSVVDRTTGAFDGEGAVAITCNKVGTVEVQVIAQVQVQGANDKVVTKYYTGTQEFAVGMDSFEDVVVMSIGSKEIVINSDVEEMLCEAVIKDGRTFVPFRAGLEALGATVDYVDGQVIAEMNGVKVVMEAGKTAYTVNGVAKTADVAPYLNVEASTTMVPAKFVADAFGINYDYTTNPDGTVADVIFAN